jgi:hypothetical protein
MGEPRVAEGLGKWSAFEKWSVGLAIGLVVFAIAGGNTADQWTGLIWAVGSLGLLVWFFSLPIALLIVGIRAWYYWKSRRTNV